MGGLGKVVVGGATRPGKGVALTGAPLKVLLEEPLVIRYPMRICNRTVGARKVTQGCFGGGTNNTAFFDYSKKIG